MQICIKIGEKCPKMALFGLFWGVFVGKNEFVAKWPLFIPIFVENLKNIHICIF
jgi:hypothetical protein